MNATGMPLRWSRALTLLRRRGRHRFRAFRSAAPRHARRPLSGRGAHIAGGRWNAPGSFPVVYASLDLDTALAETLAFPRSRARPDHAALPRTFVSFHARLGRVLDLTRGRTRQRLGVSLARMVCGDWRDDLEHGRTCLTHHLARAARDAGFEAILVPSAAKPGGVNLVLFPDRLLPGSRLALGTPCRASNAARQPKRTPNGASRPRTRQ